MDTPLGSVLYITLGCAKNEVDTDRMRSLLTAAGYEEAFDPQDADIAIVNTYRCHHPLCSYPRW